MSDIDRLFAILREFDGKPVDNAKFDQAAPIVEKICTDYAKREEFLSKFRSLNDKDFQRRIYESFNFAIAKLEEFKNGLITDSELAKVLLGSGGISAIIAGSIAAITGATAAIVALAPIVVGLGVIALLGGVALYYYQQNKKNARERTIVEIKSLLYMMEKGL